MQRCFRGSIFQQWMQTTLAAVKRRRSTGRQRANREADRGNGNGQCLFYRRCPSSATMERRQRIDVDFCPRCAIFILGGSYLNRTLTEDQLEAIREMRARNPRLSLMLISAQFGISRQRVGRIINGPRASYLSKPKAEPKPPRRSPLEQSLYGCFPVPLSKLMAGR
jgi:hypothetical protein